MEEGKIL